MSHLHPETPPYATTMRRLAASLDAGTSVGDLGEAEMRELAALTMAFCGARYDRGEPVTLAPPFTDAPTTAAMVTASAILKACEVELFELGMWQTFAGPR